MKATLFQENLNFALTTASRVVSNRANIPILENLLFSANKEGLVVSGTDLETGVVIFIPAKIEKEGKLTVPAKRIVEFVSSLPAQEVILAEKANSLTVSCKNYQAVFNGMPADDFPVLASLKDKKDKQKSFLVEAGTFLKGIEKVVFSAANDESRPVLNAVRLEMVNNSLQLVATDGYRLSLNAVQLEKTTSLPTMLIPSRALVEVMRVLSGKTKEKDTFSFTLTDRKNQAIFSFDNIEVVCRLIEGQYPDFQKIIPEEGETKLIIETEEFKKAVRASAIFARESANIVKFSASDNFLSVSANAAQVGSNEVKLKVKKQGPDAQIAFNWRFLQDFLTVFDEDLVQLEISGALQPGLFRSTKDKKFLHIIMPVRVQE